MSVLKPETKLTDSKLALAWERNFANWNSHVRGENGSVDRSLGFTWILDGHAIGSSSIHRVRLKKTDSAKSLNPVISKCRKLNLGFKAYVSNNAKPKSAESIFKDAGFHLYKRFDTLACELDRIPREKSWNRQIKVQRINDLSVFDDKIPHPLMGPITTTRRRAWLKIAQQRLDKSPKRCFSFFASVDGRLVGSCTVFFDSGIAGIYDVGTLKEVRRRGIGTAVTFAALEFARKQGFKAAGLIASWQGALVYRRIGFRPVGKMSYLYYSKKQHKKTREKQ